MTFFRDLMRLDRLRWEHEQSMRNYATYPQFIVPFTGKTIDIEAVTVVEPKALLTEGE